MSDLPYWRLSSLYFFYFAVVGIVSPYWGLYLDFIGFTPTQIGLIVAVPMISRIFAPNLWGWLADKSGKYLTVIQLGAVGAVLGFIGLFFTVDFWGVLLFASLFTFFWNAILPQFEVITLDALKSQTHQYSKIRLWGSIGFIVTVVGLGYMFEIFSVSLLPMVLWLFLIAIALTSFILPKSPHKQKTKKKLSIWPIVSQKPVFLFLLAAALCHLSHGVYYGFYSLFMAKAGYSSEIIGLTWAVGVVAEIILFIKIPQILKRYNLWLCYSAALLAAGIRWLVIGFFPNHIVLIFAIQTLHALTFALAHSVAIEFVRQSFAPEVRGSGQAFYSAICFGGGGALGAYLCGYLWEWAPLYCFIFASVAAFAGVAVTMVGLRSSVRCNTADQHDSFMT